MKIVKICKKLSKSDWLAGWVNSGPPSPPLPLPPGKKISQRWAQRRRLLLVSVGLDCQTCIERRLGHDCLDVFVGWLLIPTRRGVDGFQNHRIRNRKPPGKFPIRRLLGVSEPKANLQRHQDNHGRVASRYMPGSPTPSKPRVVFFSGPIPVRFVSWEGWLTPHEL